MWSRCNLIGLVIEAVGWKFRMFQMATEGTLFGFKVGFIDLNGNRIK